MTNQPEIVQQNAVCAQRYWGAFRGRVRADVVAHGQSMVREVYVCEYFELLCKPSRSCGAAVAASLLLLWIVIVVGVRCQSDRSPSHGGNSRLIGSWPQSRLLFASISIRHWPPLRLPWSTRRFPFSLVLWLLAVLPTIRWPAFLSRCVHRPAFLPLAFVALAIAGLFWTEDSWPVGIQGVVPVSSCWRFRSALITTNAPQRGQWVLSRSWPPVFCSWDCHG